MLPRRFYVIIWTAFLVLAAFALSSVSHHRVSPWIYKSLLFMQYGTALVLPVVSASILIFGPSSIGHRVLLGLPLPFVATLLFNWKLILRYSSKEEEVGIRTLCIAMIWLVVLLTLWIAKRVLAITTSLWSEGREIAKTRRLRFGISQMFVVTASSSLLFFLANAWKSIVPVTGSGAHHYLKFISATATIVLPVLLLAPLFSKRKFLALALGTAALVVTTGVQGMMVNRPNGITHLAKYLGIVEMNTYMGLWATSVGIAAYMSGFQLTLFDTSLKAKSGTETSV